MGMTPRVIGSMSAQEIYSHLTTPAKQVSDVMDDPMMQARDATLVEGLTALLTKPQQEIVAESLALCQKIFELQETIRTYAQNHERQCAQIRVQKARIKRILLKWADFKARSVAKGFRYITSKADRKDGMR